ncbi:uncharacterized protein [Procambarus clarkii]|uniref:uncharacterized protein n=1 Tax=Procambarus clarkii TaxID=6728 RepID=UPI00374209C7
MSVPTFLSSSAAFDTLVKEIQPDYKANWKGRCWEGGLVKVSVRRRSRRFYIRSCTPTLDITLASLLNLTTSTTMRCLSVLAVLAVMVALAYGYPTIGIGAGLGAQAGLGAGLGPYGPGRYADPALYGPGPYGPGRYAPGW